MKKIKKNPINSSSIVGSERNPDGTFREGHIKVGGKELGTRDFATDFDEAVEEIAKENKMTKSEVRKLLLKVAYRQAKDGNYSFYKDIHDRIYGQALQKVDTNMNLKIEKLEDIQAGLKKVFNEPDNSNGQ